MSSCWQENQTIRPSDSILVPPGKEFELEHRNIDRNGVGWESVRDGVDNEAGADAPSDEQDLVG